VVNSWSGEYRPRLATEDGKPVDPKATHDSYVNFMASVGSGTFNQHAGSTYGFNPITRQRQLLEWMYRGSWVCGVAVDAVADDMVKMGIDFGGTIPPQDSDQLDKLLNTLQLWDSLNELIKWGRLYGGAIAVLMVEDQDPATPLRVETIGKGKFKGLAVFDRWQVEPTLNTLVTEPGPDRGLPEFYRTHADSMSVPRMTIHHSRVLRYEGIRLPYWQKVTENLWGMSIYERLWDRLNAFDSTTQGIAQLVYRAYLRIVKLKDLREVAAMSPAAQLGLMKRIEMMTRFQTNEGITLLGEGDEFQSIAYAFGGLDAVLLQIGQQLCGALQIPAVRLFGQSPAGLNATGDSDWRNYYDGIHQQQELRLRRGITAVLHCAAKSEGVALPDEWSYQFRPLWQMTTVEKANVAEVNTRTILGAEELGIVPRKTVLQELRQSSRETGIWSTITDEQIEEAEEDLPPSPAEMAEMGMMGGVPGQTPQPQRSPGQPGGAPGEEPGKSGGPVPRPTIPPISLKGTAAKQGPTSRNGAA
jgi:phage-related protein (TIGR01555 family)